jgi:hypothetical protein
MYFIARSPHHKRPPCTLRSRRVCGSLGMGAGRAREARGDTGMADARARGAVSSSRARSSPGSLPLLLEKAAAGCEVRCDRTHFQGLEERLAGCGLLSSGRRGCAPCRLASGGQEGRCVGRGEAADPIVAPLHLRSPGVMEALSLEPIFRRDQLAPNPYDVGHLVAAPDRRAVGVGDRRDHSLGDELCEPALTSSAPCGNIPRYAGKCSVCDRWRG